jgi:hypothetical protein
MKHLLKRFPDALRIRGAHEELPIEIAWRLNLGFETYADIYGVDPDFADVRYLNQYFEKKVMVVTMLCFSQFAVGENILPFGVGGRGLNHFSSRMWRKIFGFLWDIEDADPIVDEFVNILDDPSLRN